MYVNKLLTDRLIDIYNNYIDIMNKKMFISIMVVIIMLSIGFSTLVHSNYNNKLENNGPFTLNPTLSSVNTGTHKLGPYGHYYWGLGNPIKNVKLWTPVILLNSPYKGCAKASSGQSFKVKYDIAGYTSCTKTTSTTSLSNVKNGGAVAWSELDTWTIYPIVLKYSTGGGGCPGPKPANYVAEITSTTDTYRLFTLLSAGSESDCNEPSSYKYDGYSSVFFHNGFNPNTWKTNSPNFKVLSGGAGCVSFTTIYTHEEIISFGISTSISGTNCFLSGTMSIIATVGS